MFPTGRLSRYISFSKPRMLSALGRCFTFDASADGYARGEGAGAVLLRLPEEAVEAARTAEQPEATLERCGLLGVAVNQDPCEEKTLCFLVSSWFCWRVEWEVFGWMAIFVGKAAALSFKDTFSLGGSRKDMLFLLLSWGMM